MSLPTVAELVKDQRVVVTLNTHDSVSTALSKLANYNITSAPVIADDGKFHGLVDIVDLLLFLIRVCTKEQKSNVTPPSSKLTTDDLGIISRRSGEFYLTSLFEVLTEAELNRATYLVHSTDSIKAAIEIFVRGVHRVAVTEDKNQIVHVLSQSDIIRWMAADFTRMGSKANVEVDKLDTKKLDSLVAAPSSTRTVEVFELMKENGVTSVAILTKDGTLEGVLSASDLKGMKEFGFTKLLLPVNEFLFQVRKEQGLPADFCVTCEASADLKTVVSRVVKTRVHRVFVVNEARRPVGVISLTDVIREVFSTLVTSPD